MELDRWLSQLDVKADRVLDIGGAQLPVRKRTKSWEVGEYLIADLREPHVDSPKPDIELDLNSDQPQAVELIESIDAIFCLEVFDYVWNPTRALILIHKLLAEGGVAYVSFPAFYPHHQPIEDDALRYMEGGLRKLIANARLELVELIPRRPETDLLDQFYRAERMRAAKHYDHAVTGWIATLRRP